MLQKDSEGVVRLIQGVTETPLGANLVTHDSTGKWLQRAITYCYYMWSPEGVALYKNLLPEKKSVRVMNDYLEGYDYTRIIDVVHYREFETVYIETIYTPEYATYLAWQKDADAYIKLLRDIELDLENQDTKFQMLRRSKDIITLGKELRTLALQESMFKRKEDNEYKPRLFESIG